MKAKFLILAGLLLMPLFVRAQGTTLTATVVDSDGTAWANGNCSLTYLEVPGSPGPLVNSSTGQVITSPVPCTLDGSGNLSLSVIQTRFIYGPIYGAGNSPGVTITACPGIATPTIAAACYSTGTIVVGSGPTQSVSAQINAAIRPPRINGLGPLAQAYNDAEVVPGIVNQYFRITDGTTRCYTAGSWALCASSGGGVTTFPLTAAVSGGAAPGATFNGSAPVTFDFHSFGAAPITNPTFLVGITTPALDLSAITGTQCLHSIGGVVSGTGSDCGSGGGSVSLTSPASTLLLSPSTIMNTGTLDLNLGHANAWTAKQTQPAPLFSDILGSTQCLHVDSSGQVSGTSADCNTGSTTNALTMNNSGAGVTSGTTFDGSVARVLSYNTLGAQQAITLTTVGSSGPATLSAGALNIPNYAGGGFPSGATGGAAYYNGSAGAISSDVLIDQSSIPFQIAAASLPTQADFTYNSGHPSSAGAAGSFRFAPDSSGNFDVSENGASLSRVCTATNGICASSGGVPFSTITHQAYYGDSLAFVSNYTPTDTVSAVSCNGTTCQDTVASPSTWHVGQWVLHPANIGGGSPTSYSPSCLGDTFVQITGIVGSVVSYSEAQTIVPGHTGCTGTVTGTGGPLWNGDDVYPYQASKMTYLSHGGTINPTTINRAWPGEGAADLAANFPTYLSDIFPTTTGIPTDLYIQSNDLCGAGSEIGYMTSFKSILTQAHAAGFVTHAMTVPEGEFFNCGLGATAPYFYAINKDILGLQCTPSGTGGVTPCADQVIDIYGNGINDRYNGNYVQGSGPFVFHLTDLGANLVATRINNAAAIQGPLYSAPMPSIGLNQFNNAQQSPTWQLPSGTALNTAYGPDSLDSFMALYNKGFGAGTDGNGSHTVWLSHTGECFTSQVSGSGGTPYSVSPTACFSIGAIANSIAIGSGFSEPGSLTPGDNTGGLDFTNWFPRNLTSNPTLSRDGQEWYRSDLHQPCYNNNGTVNCGWGGTVNYQEQASATGTAGNTITFTPAFLPQSLMIFKNGSILTPTTDWTAASNIVTLGSSVLTTDKLVGQWTSSTSATGNMVVSNVVSCTRPTMNSVWAANNVANLCAGGIACTNGALMQSMAAIGTANLATAFAAGGHNTAIYQTGVVNSQPAVFFTTGDHDQFNLATPLPTSGQITVYSIFKTQNSANLQDLFSGSNNSDLEWYVNAGSFGVNAKSNSVVVTGGTIASNTWTTAVMTYDYGTGVANIYSCSSGTCSSVATGTHSVATDGMNLIGANGGYLDGWLTETGWRTGIGSLNDIAVWGSCEYGTP